ncbi:hypothetical protein [Clostridium drakei]|nr:hypothetical protein [Clostridium drakei]
MKAIVICFREDKVICINENLKEIYIGKNLIPKDVKQYDALIIK